MSREKRLIIEAILILLATAGWTALTNVPMAIFTLGGGVVATVLFMALTILLCAGFAFCRHGRVSSYFSLKDFLWGD